MDGEELVPNRPVGLPVGPEVAQHQEKEVVESAESGKEIARPSVNDQNATNGSYYQQWLQESRSHRVSESQTYNAHQNPMSQDYSYYQTPGSQDNRFHPSPSHQSFFDSQAHGRKKPDISRTGWITIAILVVLIIGGAVGGGVGGSLAVEKAKAFAAAPSGSYASVTSSTASTSQSATATATATNTYYAVPTDVTVPDVQVVVGLECPSINKTSDTAGTGVTWQLTCGADFVGPGIDILAATAYSWRDCVRACATYNKNSGRNGCLAISYNADLSDYVKAHNGNCFLKNKIMNGTASYQVGGRSNRYLTAQLSL